MDADVVVHESTLSDEYRSLAIARGHATPGMAGAFARDIRAKQLILTHFGGRFACDFDFVQNVMVQQAQRAFGSDRVIAAQDFLTHSVPIQLSSLRPDKM